jgi:hypothetical protein
VISVCQGPNILSLIEDETLSELLVEAIDTLVLFSGEQEFQEILVKQSKDLIVHVSLNLMRTSKHEISDLESDPEQFVNLALDVCDKQKSRVIKTQGAKLLEALCDNIDGAVSFVTLFSCQSICMALGNGLSSGNIVQSIENTSQYFY